MLPPPPPRFPGATDTAHVEYDYEKCDGGFLSSHFLREENIEKS
jgi:hypothetical protein